jgi:hypothetical protein
MSRFDKESTRADVRIGAVFTKEEVDKIEWMKTVLHKFGPKISTRTMILHLIDYYEKGEGLRYIKDFDSSKSELDQYIESDQLKRMGLK